MPPNNVVHNRPYRPVDADTPLYEKVVQQIEERITSGELQVGDRLPSQRQLASELSVSHVAIKEALRTLAAKGLVEVKRGSGAYVADRSILAISDIMMLFVDDRSIDDLNVAREYIETEVVRLAVRHASADDVADLRKAIEYMREELSMTGSTLESNSRFHRSLAHSCHNVVYQVLAEVLLRLVRNFQHPRLHIVAPLSYHHRLRVHERIVEAVDARDLDKALNAMRDHWQEAREAWAALLSQQHAAVGLADDV